MTREPVIRQRLREGQLGNALYASGAAGTILVESKKFFYFNFFSRKNFFTHSNLIYECIHTHETTTKENKEKWTNIFDERI